MTPSAGATGLIETPLARGSADVMFVSLGTTIGLQVADAQFIAGLRAAGLEVEVVHVPKQRRDVPTLMLTDLLQAWRSRVAVKAALDRIVPRALVYSTTTAALLAPPGRAIRFDALAQRSRPGRHGLWQRPLERFRLRRAPLLLPWDAASLDGAPDDAAKRAVVVPVPVDATDVATGVAPEGVAITYAADAAKKGLDRLLAAWAIAHRDGERLVVTGRTTLPDEFADVEGVDCIGQLPPADFRRAVASIGVLAIAPRREDYGLVQLEALAAGARVVTTTAPGPYAALPLIRELWPEQVVDDADDPVALAAALRHAIDARAAEAAADAQNDEDRARAREAVAPWAPDAVLAQIERDVVPRLLDH